MIITKIGTTSVVTREATTFPQFFERLNKTYSDLAHDNIIIDLFSLENISHVEISDFLQLSKTHRSNRHSFVIVSRSVDLEEIPEELIVVPSLQEAHDIIEMEEIERDLFNE